MVNAKSATFEEAVKATGYGLFNIVILLTSGGCLMCVILETMSMMFVIPAAQCDLQLDLTDKGLLSAISYAGVVSSSHLWGFMADTRGRKKILTFTIFTSFVLTLIASVVSESWSLILLRFLNGFFIGGSSGVVYAYVGEFHDRTTCPKVVSWISIFIAFANTLLAGFAWIIISQDWSFLLPLINVNFRPWRLLIIANGLPSLLFGTILVFLPESPKYLIAQGQNEKAMDVLRRIYSVNTGKDKETFPISQIIWEEPVKVIKRKRGILKKMWSQTVPLFRRPFAAQTILVCVLQFGAFALSSGIMMWYPQILNNMSLFRDANNSDSTTVCEAMTYATEYIIEDLLCKDQVNEDVFLVTLMLGAITAGLYALIGLSINIFGKKRLLVSFLTISGVAALIAQYVRGITILQILLGVVLSAGTCIGIINAIIVDIYPTHIRAMALAICLMVGRIGAIVGSHLTGPLFFMFCDYSLLVFFANNLVLIITTLLLSTSTHLPKMITPVA